ncbi:MAG: hypothetical protein ACE37B_13875 [Ilumatobacter sp.]|uniref:hypothetical protein n=1 Tax=Ilumatobacter sp. TaxID=1967498 RepID=UPI00391D5E24
MTIIDVCRQCGSALGSGERFCGECGTAVAGNEPASSGEPAEPPPAVSVPAEPPPPVGPPLSPTAAPSGAGAGSSSQRTAIYVGGGVAAALLVAAGLWFFGRSDSGDSVATDPNPTTIVVEPTVPSTEATDTALPTTAVPETAVPETAVPETTAPPATAAPETSPPTTTAPTTPPTTAPAVDVPAGWRPGEMIPQSQIPPFESSWSGVPSPMIDPAMGPPDGVYWVDYVAQDGASLTLLLGRFESCSVLNDEFVCGPGPYGSNAIGRVEPGEGEVTLPLDATVRVVIEGWACEPVVLEGNGADLAAIYSAFEADYTRSFTAGLEAGADPYDLMAAARNDPTTGFSPPPAACDDGFSLVWRAGDGPPLLVQYVADFETGGPVDPATLIIPTAVDLAGDLATVYFYAGFFS